jgi:internalin A
MSRLAAIVVLLLCAISVRADDKTYADELKAAGNSVKLEKDGTLSAIMFAKSEKLTDSDFEKLGDLKELTKLTFYGDCKMTDAQAAHVGKLGTLEELAINGTALSDAGFKEFAKLKNLRSLTIWHLGWQNKSLTGTGFAALADCPKLERFNFSGSTVGDDGLKAIVKVKTLTEVVCYHTRITDAGLKNLKELPKLKTINVGPQFSMRLGDMGLATLCEILTLERITYDETILTAASLQHLKSLKGLKELVLNKTEVSAADLDKLKTEVPGVTIKHTPPEEKMLDQMRKIQNKK